MQHEGHAEPTRMGWQQHLVVGHAVIDAQHQALLAQCNRLAETCAGSDPAQANLPFDQALAHLKALAHAHFETEALLLASVDPADPEDPRAAYEEFEYLADEIATTQHFDRLELQRFLALWCLGHVTESAAQLRACLADRNASR